MSLKCYVKMRMHYSTELRPHLIDEAVESIENHLDRIRRIYGLASVLEIGAGSSTIWFAIRVGEVTSYEHDEDYFNTVSEELAKRKIDNVSLFFDHLYPQNGVKQIGEFDVILIDGRGRVNCIFDCYKMLKTGGILILDDSQRKKYGRAMRFLDGLGWMKQTFAIEDGNRYGYSPSTTIWKRPC